ncbi:TIGR02587 family membrane protein [Leptolyngbya sp. FACHB-671]|uniref:TIGR02587 family membrane protein n=1 Tax=unclassified Leptolyngbya TaxID=2650499 RepID=UPI00168848A5|nr:MULTISPECIES: TIGR02587 family membrane protein [unclassified Leptolyngbya]MBD1998535.1 TIGR02587 family membrane protein [Leptolyngbya sp. FACHB-541]MBD2071408.1 TIGR02587 family membrane protein [Leptolyngbya sp. FACHB-671]
MDTAKKHRKNVWLNELDDIIRGACGGFLFGIPLLYTMEVWWIGSVVEPPLMLLAIAITYIVIFLLNRTAGFRKIEKIRAIDAARNSVEAISIGIVCATVMLTLLREINSDVSLDEMLGKVLFESLPFTLGVALANQFLRGDRGGNEGQRSYKSEINATFSDIGATLIGAAVIALNIAPTDEVVMLASAVSGGRLLAIIAASLIISYGIVFQSGFADQQKRMQQQGVFQRPMSETLACYLVSLAAAAFMLWFFHQLSFGDPWTMWLQYTLILGLPATVGGAAGRLAV